MHTIRQDMMALLDGRTFSAKELSAELGIPEKEVYDHLFHIQRTVGHGKDQLIVEPAVCLKCGFIFKKRDRLTRPGKCPVCRGQQISLPVFSINRTTDE